MSLTSIQIQKQRKRFPIGGTLGKIIVNTKTGEKISLLIAVPAKKEFELARELMKSFYPDIITIENRLKSYQDIYNCF